MLVLKRKIGEAIMLGDQIEVRVLDVDGETVKLGFKAPLDIQILRKELVDSILQENLRAGSQKVPQGQLIDLMKKTNLVRGEKE